MTLSTDRQRPPARYLPEAGSTTYHLMLSSIALFLLGPLGGLAATYMNLSLGFFVGGQVLAGILGSAATFRYGAEGRHGANYIQTMAASVAAMSAMGVLIQAMVWLGLELPPAWQMMVFFGCVGMLGVGIGMLYTPLLVDRLQLTYPSGLAVANILRALTDERLLKRSIGQLGGGFGIGAFGAGLAEKVAFVAGSGLSVSTLGAGIVVGSRIAVPGLVMAALGALWTPTLRAWGWLAPDAPFRKLGFLAGLAMILGAAAVDIVIIFWKTIQRAKDVRRGAERRAPSSERPLALRRLAAWVLFWSVATVLVGRFVLNQPVFYLSLAVLLSLVFVLINGISQGVSDSNPISSAFVIAVLLMSALGLRDPVTGIIAASILLVATSVGCDMQQDRSTGARLGSDRDIQFRYQAVGIIMGAVMCVGLVQLFMKAYPVLTINTFADPSARVGHWQSAMTYKFVGAVADLGHLDAYKLLILQLGLAFGVVTETARKLLHANAGYRRFIRGSRRGFAAGWLMDSVWLSSPYALSFGAFVELKAAVWFAAGGVFASLLKTLQRRPEAPELPEDMDTLSLVGGGLIAGEAVYALLLASFGLLELAR